MMRIMVGLRALFVLLVVLATGGTIWAQASGSIVGTVSDSLGAVVPEATVMVSNTGTGESKTGRSGATGDYQFLQLLPGMYRITVEGTGFKKLVRDNVEVTVGNATRIDAALQLGGVTETVEVTTESPLLSTQTSSLNYEVGTKQIDALPLNGRNPLNLVALVPGVVPQGNTSGNASTLNVNGWGNYQIGGGAANQSSTFIDGAPINISYANSTSLVPSQDVIQEFQVATNNVSPEFGRFAGGVINMATKAGTNAFHGTAYEYYRDTIFNANLYFSKHNPANLLVRAPYVQHQFGGAVGGPIRKDHTFFFTSWEEFSLNQASPTTATVPTLAMINGDFSQVTGQLYDPVNKDAAGNRLKFGDGITGSANNNQLQGHLNPTAVVLAKMLFPAPTNSALTNNFSANIPKTTVYNQYTARFDHQLNAKNQLFARGTNWHKNRSGSSNLNNQIGNKATFGTMQAVVGDSFTITPNLVGQGRAAFLRFFDQSIPFLCCKFNMGTLLGNWSSYQSQITLAQLPQPNIAGFNNFSTGATILDVDNSYVVSGNLTWTKGRHSIEFGGESRRIEWGYQQSNSPGGTFAFDAGYSASKPPCSAPCSAPTGGYSFASYMLGFPTAGSAQEPASSLGTMYYSGLFVGDSFRASKKLTVNAGLRWEQPGSFHERNGSLSTLDLTTPQPTLASAAGAPISAGLNVTSSIVGGLDLVSTSRHPSRNWQELHWTLFSPRVGLAYSPNDKTVVRAGFGISYLPNTVAFSLGPYNNPPNSAVTTMTTSLDGNQNPYLGTTLSNPFPSGISQPPGRNQAYIDSLLGNGIQSPLSHAKYPYSEQWNAGVQRQFGGGLVIDAGYVGTHGVDLPLYSINHDQLPNQYNNLQTSTGASDLFTKVPNPFYGIIPASAGILGQQTIGKGYLLKPMPQYQYVTEDSPAIAGSSYQALQVRAEKRFKSAGVLLVSYTYAHLQGTADVLTGYLETSRFGVGGASGVQDNNNIAGEQSKSSFDVPNRAVVSYTLGLPFGRGKWLLSNANGFVDRLVGDWKLNGIATFQSGFPLAFQYSVANTIETNFAAGNAGPGLPAGVSRPDRVVGCNPVIAGAPKTKLTKYFNTACFVKSSEYAYGNEPRVDPDLRAEGIDNFDLSVAKSVAFEGGVNFEFRAEAFNLFNRTQFAPPNAQVDVATYGTVASQVNQPRLLQLSGRINF